MTSGLLPTPDVNISHHIMRQALEHEAACGGLGGQEEAGESRGGEEWERMTGRAETHHCHHLLYNHADIKQV